MENEPIVKLNTLGFDPTKFRVFVLEDNSLSLVPKLTDSTKKDTNSSNLLAEIKPETSVNKIESSTIHNSQEENVCSQIFFTLNTK